MKYLFLVFCVAVAGWSGAASAAVNFHLEGDIAWYDSEALANKFGESQSKMGTISIDLEFSDYLTDDDAVRTKSYAYGNFAAYHYTSMKVTVGNQTWQYSGGIVDPGNYAEIFDRTDGYEYGYEEINFNATEDVLTGNGLTVSYFNSWAFAQGGDNISSTDIASIGSLISPAFETNGFFDTELGTVYFFKMSVTEITQIGTPAIPEPATWLMMIMGFGLTGMAVRRRGRQLRIG